MRKSLLIVLIIMLAGTLGVWASGKTATTPDADAVTVKAGKFGESPMLAAMVKAGTLPPVEERLPPEPMVLEVVDEIGKYGGTATVFALNINPWNDLGEMGENGPSYYPYIFTAMDLADDYMSLTAVMRPGIKWSDGTPLTSLRMNS